MAEQNQPGAKGAANEVGMGSLVDMIQDHFGDDPRVCPANPYLEAAYLKLYCLLVKIILLLCMCKGVLCTSMFVQHVQPGCSEAGRRHQIS